MMSGLFTIHHFCIDRGLCNIGLKLVSLSRLRVCGYIKYPDDSQQYWRQFVLWSLEEFLGCDESGQVSLDKDTLARVSECLKRNADLSPEYLQERLRPAWYYECPTYVASFCWPESDSERDAMILKEGWESNIEQSRFATTGKKFSWVSAAYLVSLVNFVLSPLPVYRRMRSDRFTHHTKFGDGVFVHRPGKRGWFFAPRTDLLSRDSFQCVRSAGKKKLARNDNNGGNSTLGGLSQHAVDYILRHSIDDGLRHSFGKMTVSYSSGAAIAEERVTTSGDDARDTNIDGDVATKIVANVCNQETGHVADQVGSTVLQKKIMVTYSKRKRD
jgi:hypothetical protein